MNSTEAIGNCGTVIDDTATDSNMDNDNVWSMIKEEESQTRRCRNYVNYPLSNREAEVLARYWAGTFAHAEYLYIHAPELTDDDDSRNLHGASEAFDDLLSTGYVTRDQIQALILRREDELLAADTAKENGQVVVAQGH